MLDGTKVVYASETERFSKKKHDWGHPFTPLLVFQTRFQSNEAFQLAPFKIGDIGSHHEHHIYEAFYQSGFKNAAVLVNDGVGAEGDCITLAYIEQGSAPQILETFAVGKAGCAAKKCLISPCGLYAFAAYSIFGSENAEGKLMGLAAYGKNNGRAYCSWNNSGQCVDYNAEALISDIEICDIKQAFRSGAAYDNDKFLAVCNIAATIQQNFEDTMVGVVKHFKQLLDAAGIQTRNLCLSGGGILNCPTNSKIVELGFFDNYYASPQPSDGCAESIGRAFYAMHNNGESLKSQRLKSAYLGASYSVDSIIDDCKPINNPTQKIAAHLKAGGVVAWYQDGAEYGPRALGHRSFLADPSAPGMLDALNIIKGREAWRPLAPVVPKRLFSLLFDAKNTNMCEFMLRTLPIKQKWQRRLQAVCHKDGSTRPQLLERSTNQQLYDLLMAYFQQTGTPCLINTSLNINGFPIVETPHDLYNLAEEITFIEKPIPKVMTVLIDGENFYEVVVQDSAKRRVPLNISDPPPNEESLEALKQSEEMIAKGKPSRFKNVDEMFESIKA